MKKVLTLLSIIAMVCVFAVPNAFAESYTLTVASSNPSSGVAITVSPNDRDGKGNGTTQFTRRYSDSTSITLAAPATTSGNTFQKWQRDGSDYSTNRTITFSLSRNRTMRAVYTTSTTSYTLTVASSNPSSGVAITVSPNDRNGQGNGTTQFTRSYASGASVTLTAPATASGNTFQKWQRDGSDYSTNRTITFTLSQNRTLRAVYTTTTTAYTLTVASSNPASGVAITVSPNDNSGQGSGTTQFTRSYNSGASVTLTAPATASGNTFQKWQRDGSDYSTNLTITFTLSQNRTLTAVYTTTTTAYTLTVASSNPASGVAITVSPNDNSGQGSGTTQFTRSYNSGASVTLTAPATASGNTFQKWQRNGVDAATTQATTVAMTANTTMTAVYVGATTAELCKDGIDNDGDGLVDCADSDCATDASCTGAVNSSHRGINAYNGPSTCTGCHGTSMATDVLNSIHGSWLGNAPNVPNVISPTGKWGQTNNYCTDPQIADFGCLKCHVSLTAPMNAQGKVDMAKANLVAADMDCMQCHQAKYFATFTPDPSTATNYLSCVDGSTHSYIVPVPEADGKIHKAIRLDLAPGETAVSLARTVHRPNNATCLLKCHAKAGGGDGTKRGDLASDMVNPPVAQDVHLSQAGTAKLVCTSCHAGTNHQIPGRGNDLPSQDTGATMTQCVDCHANMATSTGHGTSTTNRQAANRHVAKVDCTACHIDRYAKGTIGTEVSRDWTAPVWNPAGCEGQGAYIGNEVRGFNLLPEYRFWNKTSWVYDRNGTVGLMTDPIDGGLAMSYPLGDMTNGKLYPFKVHTSKNPIDNSSGKTTFDVLQMFQTGCFDNAAVSGLSFIGETGAYTWTANKAFQLITHGVAPKATANDCTKCHSGTVDTSTISKLDKLGYKTPKPTSDLCNDCHSTKTNNNFFTLHDYHVRQRGYNCSRCHSFSRP